MTEILTQPKSDQLGSFTYRQKLSWEIKEDDWKSGHLFKLQLKSEIPGAYHEPKDPPAGWTSPYPGGYIALSKEMVQFVTHWPKDLEIDEIKVDAVFSLKSNDGNFSLDIKGGVMISSAGSFLAKIIKFVMKVAINPEQLYDKSRSFTFEADLLVERKKTEIQKPNAFANEIEAIYEDEKYSDVLIIAETQRFKCHKNILCARSEVFKNTLAHDTEESRTNVIEVKEVPAKAVEVMLKHIYSGDLPKDPEDLTTDLLHVADMYQLHCLREACGDHLIKSLDVSSCISTFILVDRYLPHNANLREMVMKFIQCKAVEVVELEECKKLVKSYPLLAIEVMRAIARASKETHRCQYCLVSYK